MYTWIAGEKTLLREERVRARASERILPGDYTARGTAAASSAVFVSLSFFILSRPLVVSS